ncbi:MAG: PEGA domain-containing protein [Kofleriaceae bacterium]
MPGRCVVLTRALAIVVAVAGWIDLAAAAPAAAWPCARRPPAPRTVAVAPLATLGVEATAAATGAVAGELERALAALPGVTVVPSTEVVRATKASKRPELRACDGEVRCLANLGRLVGADLVVFGELGGLGDAQIVYLALVDAAAAREVRTTTHAVGQDADGGPAGAATRLLEPDRYVGALALAIDVGGASVYVNGQAVGRSPIAPLTLPVGTHAVRVTHPEFRDFVRFVDVTFAGTAAVDVGHQQYPIVSTDVDERTAAGGNGERVVYRDPPWYRRWWVLAAAGALVATTAGITAGLLADGLCDGCTRRPIDAPPR